jgi:hypothetical protein
MSVGSSKKSCGTCILWGKISPKMSATMERSQRMTKKSCIHEAIGVEKVFSNLTFIRNMSVGSWKKKIAEHVYFA